MRVLNVKVVTARLDFIDTDLPGELGFFPSFPLRAAPPVDTALKVLEADRFRHRVGFLARRHAVLIEPDVLGRLALFEEQQIGADAGIGLEDAVRKPDDSVERALLEKMLLQARLYPF